MPNQAQNPNEQKKYFWHLSIWICLELRGAKQMGSQKIRRIFGVKSNPYEQD